MGHLMEVLHNTTVSIARLHGEACGRCGAVDQPLHPAAEVTVYDWQWQVVVCDDHQAVPL